MRKLSWLAGFFIFVTTQILMAAPEFVKVSGGTLQPFWFKPQKGNLRIIYKVKSLEVQKNQVTNSDFIRFLNENPQWHKEKISDLFAERNYLEHINNNLQLSAGAHNQAPVTSVTWFAARAYCESLGARLPSINEWEYLAAASEKAKDANQNPEFLKRILDWYVQLKEDRLLPVGRIYKNIYGIEDMHGLVWEWVEDFNSSLVSGESREDSSFNKDLFCGAGGLNSGDKENYAAFMRFAFRSSLKGTSAIWNLGFRCVKDLKKSGANK